MADAPPPALHALLGLSTDVTVADLRSAYDRAMAKAVRMGDTQRALALSRAFDALPAGLNRQVYSAVAHRRAPVDTLPPRPPRGGSLGRSTSRLTGGRTTGRRSVGGVRRGRMSRARRLTVAAVAVVVIGAPLGVVVGLHWKQWMTRPGAPPPSPAQVTTVPAPGRTADALGAGGAY